MQARRVVVVGAGALGNEVVRVLGMAGVEQVVLVDPDVVEEKNLALAAWFRGQVGRKKVDVVAEAARSLFPGTEWAPVDREIADVGFGVVAEADVLFGCVDNELARLEMAYIGTKLDLPVCDGGLGPPEQRHGRVSCFPGRAGACYGCRLTADKRRELLTTWDSPAHPCTTEVESPERSSTPAMAALVGALEVEIGLHKVLAAQSVEVWMTPAPRLERIELKRSEACPFHQAEEHLVEGGEGKVGDLLQGAIGLGNGQPALLLDWPICVDAQCRECGRKFHPMRRVGWLRRRGVCPHCGSRLVRDLETLTRIAPDSVWAGATFAELGLPERHLHTIRFEAT